MPKPKPAPVLLVGLRATGACQADSAAMFCRHSLVIDQGLCID